uniref:Uncharacterized protein n=1 Tax=Anopheles culicifacies TaxID=139723 RepID=A0A182M432_9DIPT
MYCSEYERRFLQSRSPAARKLFVSSESPSSNDRFIPCRVNNNWVTNFATISTKSNENSPQSTKKQRDCGENARDSVAYSCLLKNELLGTGIDDVKLVADDKSGNGGGGGGSGGGSNGGNGSGGGLHANSNRTGLFKYQSPTKQSSASINRQ